uniref:Uncharacterized protein n=1 Tax=Zea mays TaxID=4577 RepID=C0PI27_MAIZE|nr:unknown [Zea mays]
MQTICRALDRYYTNFGFRCFVERLASTNVTVAKAGEHQRYCCQSCRYLLAARYHHQVCQQRTHQRHSNLPIHQSRARRWSRRSSAQGKDARTERQGRRNRAGARRGVCRGGKWAGTMR